MTHARDKHRYATVTSGTADKNADAPGGGRRSFDMLNVVELAPHDKLAEWVSRGRKSIFTITVDMDPGLASLLLERNPENRPVRYKGLNRSVEAYAAAMLRGEWLLNGEPVIISRDGLLNDGQHRLHAVLASGTTVPMQVTFGVDRDSRHTVDQGAGRTPGNILSMFGEKETNHLAHGLHFVWSYDDKGRLFSYRPSPEQLLDTLDRNPGMRDAVRAVRAFGREFRLSIGYMAASHYVCGREFRDHADEFLDGASTGLNISDKNSPIFRLRKRFQEHAAKRENIPALEQAALYIKAFNAFRRHKPMNNLVWRRNGAAAEDFPAVGA